MTSFLLKKNTLSFENYKWNFWCRRFFQKFFQQSGLFGVPSPKDQQSLLCSNWKGTYHIGFKVTSWFWQQNKQGITHETSWRKPLVKKFVLVSSLV